MCNSYWIGIDLSKQTFHAAIAATGSAPKAWACLPHEEFSNSAEGIHAFCDWVAQQVSAPDTLGGICIEATGRLTWTWIAQLGDTLVMPSMVNPARPVAYGKSLGLRDKTDRIDACILALYGMANRPVPRPLPSPHMRQLKELATHYTNERTELMACQNRLGEAIQSPFIQKQLTTKRRTLQQRIQKIEAEMDRLIDQDSQLKKDAQLIQTIPGVAAKTVRVLLAQYGDLRQYTRNELIALAGLYPKHFQSGTSVHRKPRLAKGGGARTRAALYMAALSARRFCPHLATFSQRLKQKGKHNASVHGAVMRKLLLLIRAVVLTNTPYSKAHNS